MTFSEVELFVFTKIYNYVVLLPPLFYRIDRTYSFLDLRGMYFIRTMFSFLFTFDTPSVYGRIIYYTSV